MGKNVTKFVWFGEGRYENKTPNQTLENFYIQLICLIIVLILLNLRQVK